MLLDSSGFSQLMIDAAQAYRMDASYAEKMLTSAKTVQLKRNTWAGRKSGKPTEIRPKNYDLFTIEELLEESA